MTVFLPDELFADLEEARGDVSRSKWVQKVLEKALAAGEATQGAKVAPSPNGPSAPSRAPRKPERKPVPKGLGLRPARYVKPAYATPRPKGTK